MMRRPPAPLPPLLLLQHATAPRLEILVCFWNRFPVLFQFYYAIQKEFHEIQDPSIRIATVIKCDSDRDILLRFSLLRQQSCDKM